MSVTAFQRRRRVQAALEVAKKQQDETPEVKPIDKMTIAELKIYAEQNVIDLGEAKKKDDILAVIQAAQSKNEDEVQSQAEQEKQLKELQEKATDLGIEDVENKDIETLTSEIAAIESKDGDSDAE